MFHRQWRSTKIVLMNEDESGVAYIKKAEWLEKKGKC